MSKTTKISPNTNNNNGKKSIESKLNGAKPENKKIAEPAKKVVAVQKSAEKKTAQKTVSASKSKTAVKAEAVKKNASKPVSTQSAQPKVKQPDSSSGKKKIAIALQGGGSHGAFSWGVLDRLLEDGRFEIEGITGTSAGGMNAVAVAQGMMDGGPQQARAELKKFWQKISEAGKKSFLNNRGPIDKMLGNYTMYNSSGFIIFDYLMRIFSPYQLNPMQIDPLKDVILECFDFEKLRKFTGMQISLCATHVFSGKLKIFRLNQLKLESLLATACLPTIHQAVLVDGEYYWDGGFIGNPVLFPLIYDCKTPDIIYIQLNPTHRNKLPTTAREIADRLNEITNNATVSREMRAVSFITQLIDDGFLDSSKIQKQFIHQIIDEGTFDDLGWSSKLNTEWDFLTHLFEKGRACADKWIKANYDKVGVQSTANLGEEFAHG